MSTYPLSLAARQQFDFQQPRFADILTARRLAAQINATRDLETQPERSVKAGVLAAANLLDEIFAYVIELYVEEYEPTALSGANDYLIEKLGTEKFDDLFGALRESFGTFDAPEAALEFAIRLRLSNANRALAVFSELFDDSVLPADANTLAFESLGEYFQTLPGLGPDNETLLEFLFSPILNHPDSLEAQLRFILQRWSDLIEPFLARLLLHLDILAEENKPVFGGPGPAQVLDYKRAIGMEEYEGFSADKDWMPSVVLLAKNTYVWLDQLSKKFKRHIYRLDQVPDEELDEMASRGMTGLWLIGLWQRSKASQRIKQMCGNPDAVASAYSLYSYDIAWELGGAEAMENLRKRAAKRGLRMASDMVPNHMAIDSRWIAEHPDWFLSLPHSPFPQYSFEGPNLSEDDRCSIFLENHYYSQSDAAVVFRHVDNRSGQERFIYHGNDGTSMPWNDTAQLNYLMPEVREAVIQTILDVARQFPVIRFDAAMTLAKRHYSRLWFPPPGEGGAIPTRAGQGLTADDFDAAMPTEFWREVVNRVAEEVPETLLLAEAFWMMEGYFVRTLGMHRVYNSAFMNMLRDEKNAEYRLTMKNTLEFDPDILGRFVNFMNNPDEKTAVEQFGKGDKYFGICTLMATLPGLPMFGHGQIEGYAEKYGMEYPRAYWDEQPDEYLIERHKREIFPILHRRPLFAGVANFTLFDFWTNDGYVNEDVFAYSNRMGDDRALVVYHNRFGDTAGWVRTSVGFAQKQPDGTKVMSQRGFGEALDLAAGEKSWSIFRDNTSNLEYLRSSRELVEKGLFVQLQAYGCHVFLDWREVRDEAGLYARLADRLQGRGVPSVETAIREMLLEPLHAPFREVADAALWQRILDSVVPPSAPAGAKTKISAKVSATGDASINESAVSPLDEFETKVLRFAETARDFAETQGDPVAMARAARARLERALQILKPARTKAARQTAEQLSDVPSRGTLIAWSLASSLGLLDGAPAAPTATAIAANGSASIEKPLAARSRDWFDEWLLAPLCERAIAELGCDQSESHRAVTIARVLVAHGTTEKSFDLVSALLADPASQGLLGINRYNGVTWFSKDGMNEILDWLEVISTIDGVILPLGQVRRMVDASEYRVVKLLELARGASVAASNGAARPADGAAVKKTRATKTTTPKAKPLV